MVKSKPLEMEMSCNSGIGIERREKMRPSLLNPTQSNKKQTGCQDLLAKQRKIISAQEILLHMIQIFCKGKIKNF
jgi:hypothetical protein